MEVIEAYPLKKDIGLTTPLPNSVREADLLNQSWVPPAYELSQIADDLGIDTEWEKEIIIGFKRGLSRINLMTITRVLQAAIEHSDEEDKVKYLAARRLIEELAVD